MAKKKTPSKKSASSSKKTASKKPVSKKSSAGTQTPATSPAKKSAVKKAVAKKAQSKKPARAAKPTAASSKTDFNSMTVTVLRALAKDAGIAGYSKMKKAELAVALAKQSPAPADAAQKIARAKASKKAASKKAKPKKKSAAKKTSKKTVTAKAGAKRKTATSKAATEDAKVKKATRARQARTPFLDIPASETVTHGGLISEHAGAVTSDSDDGATHPEHGEPGLPIPDSYGRDFMAAMARDPEWIFVYWESAGGRLDEYRHRYSPEQVDTADWTLRVSAVGHPGHYDLRVDGATGNWYVKVTPGATYNFELGLVTASGKFLPIADARGIETPSAGVSDTVDESWMIIRRDLEALMASMGEDMFAPTGSSRGSGLVHKTRQRFDVPRAVAYFSASLIRMPSSGYLSESPTGDRMTNR